MASAQVPGVVQTDLLNSKLIPDPFDRDNEFHLQWIGLADWEYQTTFQLDAAALAHDHLDLVFDGLDTFADVYLNDQAISAGRQHVPPLAGPGKDAAEAWTEYTADRFPFCGREDDSLRLKTLPYIFALPSQPTIMETKRNIATAPYTRKAPYNYGWDWGPRFMTEGIWQAGTS